MKYKIKVFFTLVLGVLLILSGCSNKKQEQKEMSSNSSKPAFKIVEAGAFTLKNIRGIGYPGNDSALYIAGNDGLKMYKDKKWYEATTNQHDYIGFQAVESGFIASGHPQEGTGLEDPLGLIKSDDKGETVQKLAFYNEANLHFTAASYSGMGLYIIGEKESNTISLGVNYSTDKGKTWNKSTFKNFDADSMGMMAVHPTDGNTMAMATRSGIYYSTDNGNTMKLITGKMMVTALTFNGDSILFSSVENEKILLKTLSPLTGEQSTIIIPFLDYDNPITYLAVNPKNKNEMAFTTYNNDLYNTIDGGKTWNNLLKDGK